MSVLVDHSLWYTRSWQQEKEICGRKCGRCWTATHVMLHKRGSQGERWASARVESAGHAVPMATREMPSAAPYSGSTNKNITALAMKTPDYRRITCLGYHKVQQTKFGHSILIMDSSFGMSWMILKTTTSSSSSR